MIRAYVAPVGVVSGSTSPHLTFSLLSSIMSSVNRTIDNTLGAVLVGFAVSCFVFGILLAQMSSYYSRYPSDKLTYKFIVSSYFFGFKFGCNKLTLIQGLSYIARIPFSASTFLALTAPVQSLRACRSSFHWTYSLLLLYRELCESCGACHRGSHLVRVVCSFLWRILIIDNNYSIGHSLYAPPILFDYLETDSLRSINLKLQQAIGVSKFKYCLNSSPYLMGYFCRLS